MSIQLLPHYLPLSALFSIKILAQLDAFPKISMALHDAFLSHFDKETSFIDVDAHYEIMR